MMLAYHIIVIGGLVVAIIILTLTVRDQIRLNRWWEESFENLDVLGYEHTHDDNDDDDGLSDFDREVRDLNDTP